MRWLVVCLFSFLAFNRNKIAAATAATTTKIDLPLLNFHKNAHSYLRQTKINRQNIERNEMKIHLKTADALYIKNSNVYILIYRIHCTSIYAVESTSHTCIQKSKYE